MIPVHQRPTTNQARFIKASLAVAANAKTDHHPDLTDQQDRASKEKFHLDLIFFKLSGFLSKYYLD